MKDARTPALLGSLSIAVNWPVAVAMSRTMGHVGIALSSVVVSWITLAASMIILENRHKREASLMSLPDHVQIDIDDACRRDSGVCGSLRAAYRDRRLHGTMHLIGVLCLAIILGGGVYVGDIGGDG